MNKSTLVFVGNDNDTIAETKQSFIEFFGKRMIADTYSGLPILKMNTLVDPFDMSNASVYIPDNLTVLIINSEESFDIMLQTYSYLTI